MVRYFPLALLCALPALAQSPLQYGSFFGSPGLDEITSSAVDANGKIWVTGYTTSQDFPIAGFAYRNREGFGGGRDVFVARLNPAAATAEEQLEYATFIGGSGADEGRAIALGQDGTVYVCGVTASADFPLAGVAFQGQPQGGDDAFVLQLNPEVGGDAGLVYSTFLGGANADGCRALAVREGRIYATGYTNSESFPIAGNALQRDRAGNWDAWAAVLNPNAAEAANSLVYCTRLGGGGVDTGQAVAAAAGGVFFVAGSTSSGDFPVTANAYQQSAQGALDVFVTRLDPGQSTLSYSTRLGGTDADEATSIALEANGSVAIAGSTLSPNFPVTTGAPQARFGGRGDAFVARLNPALEGAPSLVWSTYLGGAAGEFAYALTTGANGELWVAGYTLSDDFPATAGAMQAASGGVIDGFVVRYDPARQGNTGLTYGTYLGGAGQEYLSGITVRDGCQVTVSGVTFVGPMPVTEGAYQTESRGFSDGYVARLNFCR